jgi:transketolase
MPTLFENPLERERCRAYRRRILELSQRGPAHVAPALSCIEMVNLIYNELLRPQDVFILSKGHGALAQYVVLESLGEMTLEGVLPGHPDLGGPIKASTGSLGHGLGIGVGMAYAEHLKGTEGKVYVLMSDGELQEGSTWEAAMMAANLNLDNLIVFVDWNDYGGMDRLSETHPALCPIVDKWKAFGWASMTADGHEGRDMCAVLRPWGKPVAVVARTTKGRGVSFMEENPKAWHYRSPTPEQYEQALAEIG